MKSKLHRHLLIGTAALSFFIHTGHAAVFNWDASGTDPLDDGGGTWAATVGTNWYNNSSLNYGAWSNTSADEAVFGANNGAAGTIAVTGTVIANKLTFNAAGSGTYTVSGGTAISLGGTTPTITVKADAAIGSVLAGSAGMIKNGSGTLP
jgi:fibronectin-binding autotransporter adhesin